MTICWCAAGANSGDEAYLVVRYEYTPGFDDVDAVSTGGQAHYWFGDHVRLGVTANVNDHNGADSSLNGADLTLRWTAGSWLKVQQAQSEGLVALPSTSADGGFEFNAFDPTSFTNADAAASRVDVAVSLSDFTEFTTADFNFYVQDVEAGFSAPGLTALADTENYGGGVNIPIGERFHVRSKLDKRTQDLGVQVTAQEHNLGFQFNRNWDVQAGYRIDERIDNAIIVPFTQEQGERTDAVLQVGYDSRSTWKAYMFAQDTVSVTGNRSDNSRAGVGGSVLVMDKLRIEGEVSSGDLGAGGRIGTNYMHSEQTSVYVNYALENERTDNAMRSIRGREGNLIAGVKTRLGDSSSVFLEERYRHNGSMTGLTHATGINFAPGSRWNFGIKSDIGTLEDLQTGAETDRTALGVVAGYSTSTLQISSAVEYRNDDVEQFDLSTIERRTWLFKNSFKYQLNADGRFVGKLNHSESESSEGAFYDGGFTEAVFGFAYRPVDNDRLNAMAKYTYFYNMPTTGRSARSRSPRSSCRRVISRRLM